MAIVWVTYLRFYPENAAFCAPDSMSVALALPGEPGEKDIS
jgi:hypothetical protein